MIKHALALAILTLVLQGCGQPDTEVSRIGGDSAFSCDQINQYIVLGDNRTADRMVSASLQLLDAKYTGDTSIEHFYRSYIRKDLDYAVQYSVELQDVCLVSPHLGLNDAASDALNRYYAAVSEIPRQAICKSYNDGKISYEAVIQEMRKPTVLVIGGDQIARRVLTVADSPKYGEVYLRKSVAEQCKANPHLRLWSGFVRAAQPAVAEIEEEAKQVIEAEAAERAKREYEEALAEYSVSLFDTGEYSCYRFSKQRQFAAADGPGVAMFTQGLKATLLTLAESLKPHQKTVFKDLFNQDVLQLAQEVDRGCNNSLQDALLRVEPIAAARTKAYRMLENLRTEKEELANGCEGRMPCATEKPFQEFKAASNALYAYIRCEADDAQEGTFCFVEPEQFYEYHLADLSFRQASAKHQKLTQQLNKPISVLNLEPDLEQCKAKAIADGLRGSAYSKRVQDHCIPSIKEAILSPIRADHEIATRTLEVAKAQYEAAASKALAM